MKKFVLFLTVAMCFSVGMMAQPPGDTSPTYPQGATYTLSNGSTVTLTDQIFDCSTQYYNAVQVSNGTLYLNNCTYTKTGDGSSGDNSSFYDNNITMTNCTINVPSGILMYVMDDDQWSTNGAIGTLVLSNGTYSGQVKYDSGYTANVTVNNGAIWNLTANTRVCSIVNNGIINTNGYTLTYTNLSGSGTINNGSGIDENEAETTINDGNIYTLDGRKLGKTLPDDFRGIYILNGKKHVKLD